MRSRMGQPEKGYSCRAVINKLFPSYSSRGQRTMDWKSGLHVREEHRRVVSTPSWVYYYIVASFGLMFFLLYLHFRGDARPIPEFRRNEMPSRFYTTFTGDWGVDRNANDYCPPQTKVFFLKTHKCASSTVQNILMRFGDQRNLTFALPGTANYIGHPAHFSKSLLSSPEVPVGGFDILCHHLRLDVQEVRSVISPSATFVTIVRDPVTLFRSMYDYYEVSNVTNQTLNEFILDSSSMEKLTNERFQDRLGNNQMMFDLGYEPSVCKNESLVAEAIREVDRTFDLVMVAEFFDESLILLKHLLCWSMEDIVYLVHNKRTVDHTYTDNALGVSQRIKEYNGADQMLYDHFVQKLNKTIERFGRERMAKEVEDLRLWTNIWFNHCVRKLSSDGEDIPSNTKAYSSKVYSFVLNRGPLATICKNLAMAELPYTKELSERQKSRLQ